MESMRGKLSDRLNALLQSRTTLRATLAPKHLLVSVLPLALISRCVCVGTEKHIIATV